MDPDLKTEIDEFAKQHKYTTGNLGSAKQKRKFRQTINTISLKFKSISTSFEDTPREAEDVLVQVDEQLIMSFVQAFTLLTSTDSTLTENSLIFVETVLKHELIGVQSEHFTSLLTELYDLAIEKEMNQERLTRIRAYMLLLKMLKLKVEMFIESDSDMGRLLPYSVAAIRHFEKIQQMYNRQEGDSKRKKLTGKKSGGSHRTAVDGRGSQGGTLPDLQQVIVHFKEFQQKWLQLLQKRVEKSKSSLKTSPFIWKTSSETVACLLSNKANWSYARPIGCSASFSRVDSR
jgi:hypothetical protein